MMDGYKKGLDSLRDRANPIRDRDGKIKSEDVTNNDEIYDNLIFAMKDKTHNFTIGLDTIIECLKIAEDEGCVPKLPERWWNEVKVM